MVVLGKSSPGTESCFHWLKLLCVQATTVRLSKSELMVRGCEGIEVEDFHGKENVFQVC